MLFDSHTHLNDDVLYAHIDEVVKRSLDADVSFFLCVGYDKASSIRALEIAHRYPFVYAAIGFHPTEAQKVTDDDLKWLEIALTDEKVKAVGEIGLDYFWDQTHKDVQKYIFIKQLQLANKYHLPVSIHMRDATKDTYEILKNEKSQDTQGIMHCFSGSVESAREFIKLNMMISLAGPVTFKNAKDPKAVASQIDLNQMLIETDAPYLAPHPYRGKENSPAYLRIIAEEIARIKNISYSEVATTTCNNAKKIFRIQ